MALTAGQTVLVAPGESPPKAPAGFHWVATQSIFSDTGGATVFTLVANDAVGDLADWSTIQSSFNQGILTLIDYFGQQQDQRSAAQNLCVVFHGNAANWKLSWTADQDYWFVGFVGQPGQAVSWNGGYANFSAIAVLATGIRPDMLLIIPSASSAGFGAGDLHMPINAGQTIWFYGNVAGEFNMFLLTK